MNWIKDFIRPKINSILSKRDVPDNLWVKDPKSGDMIYRLDFEANLEVYPSGTHGRLRAKNRLNIFFDNGDYETLDIAQTVEDPLNFQDQKNYKDRLKEARKKTEMQDSVISAVGKVFGIEMAAAVQDFAFLGGSLGVAAGEAIVCAMHTAVERHIPCVLFAASGGARMQEGMLSLMQMPRTVAARLALRDAGLPYIVVLTDPTTGGVTASCAMLGDLHIAEPNALIGFAGPRVIEQTIRETLPGGFQRAEYLLEHGMVDMVLPRKQLRQKIASITSMMLDLPKINFEAFADKDASADDEKTEVVDETHGDPSSVPNILPERKNKRNPVRERVARTLKKLHISSAAPELNAVSDGTLEAESADAIEKTGVSSTEEAKQETKAKVTADKKDSANKISGSSIVASAYPPKVKKSRKTLNTSSKKNKVSDKPSQIKAPPSNGSSNHLPESNKPT